MKDAFGFQINSLKEELRIKSCKGKEGTLKTRQTGILRERAECVKNYVLYIYI